MAFGCASGVTNNWWSRDHRRHVAAPCGNQLALPLHWQVAPTGTVAPLHASSCCRPLANAYDK
ncbi:MAG: hypothetical protein R2867_17135 [Caldilineaceae bacterium]